MAPIPGVASAWNFFFNLFINIIMTAIISGIIIDTFGMRREKKEALKDDTNNRCFICNIDREVKINFLFKKIFGYIIIFV